MQCLALCENSFLVFKGQPCKILEMLTPHTGKWFHQDICPSTLNMDIPNIKRYDYQTWGGIKREKPKLPPCWPFVFLWL
ncbi:unnamed protein product [Nyctereutes procyonoides]|uniref:(raccoon dog) hypothetical protein n=1 Tax=Nyctereutes procyonoides TaxID=34880 RepID=A0A811Y9M8_NYCPR|nr:unnamed protein product [Nyctereutes procyonoides]